MLALIFISGSWLQLQQILSIIAIICMFFDKIVNFKYLYE
jgi:hypothetical protein